MTTNPLFRIKCGICLLTKFYLWHDSEPEILSQKIGFVKFHKRLMIYFHNNGLRNCGIFYTILNYGTAVIWMVVSGICRNWHYVLHSNSIMLLCHKQIEESWKT